MGITHLRDQAVAAVPTYEFAEVSQMLTCLADYSEEGASSRRIAAGIGLAYLGVDSGHYMET